MVCANPPRNACKLGFFLGVDLTFAPDMNIINHWLESARRIVSPNADARPDLEDISLIVLHYISLPPGQFGFGYIDQLFTNALEVEADPYFKEIARLRVSAHALIRRDGEIVQYVPLDRRAWHAGLSSFRGRPGCNDYSIGIELEGTEDLPFTDRQYEALAEVLEALFREYPGLSPERVAGHSDIAPGRKTDPGPCFDWARLAPALESRTASGNGR
jgi:AmpD protein